MKLYENVVVGNFLYGLGYAIGKVTEGIEQLSVINLLQQTPADKALGDVLLEYPGIVRLIEFKNRDGSLKKEKDKCNQLKLSLGDNEKFMDLSRKVHWYVETKPFEETCFNNIKPYIDAFTDLPSLHTVDSFINEIADEVTSPTSILSSEELEAYMHLVTMCQGDGKVGTGGIIVSFSEEGLRYLQFSDIMQLRLQHKDFVQEVKTEHKELMKKLDREHTYTKKFAKGLSL